MIEFVCGRAGSGKSEYVAEKIRRALDRIGDPLRGGSPKKLYLIVPEQQAVVWESRVARSLPPSAALSLEIVNFTRLCDLFARVYGGLTDRAITRGGKAALMWSTLCSLSPSLQIYGGSTRPERAAPALLSAVSEMKRCGVTPAQLSDAAERLAQEPESLPLARRVQELSLITAAYQHLLQQRYTDDEDALSHLEMRLADAPFFAGADVFVDSFFSLTPVENRILYHIFRQAENVTVTFACPARDSGEAQFASPRSFLAAMRQAAERAHREYTVVSLTENRRAETEMLRRLEENLWRFDAPAFPALNDGSVRVLQVKDRYAEADAAVSRIRALVQDGARYSDIALIARSAEKLRGILDTALTQSGIPCFFSENSDVPGRPAARLLFAALSVAGGGWRREDVILCAKTGLCTLTDDECDALEIYTDTWHIRGERAFSSPWNMNPDGYVAGMTQRAKKVLLCANDARDKLIPPLARFASVFTGGTAPVREICRAAYELYCDYGVWDALQASSAALAAQGRAREAAEDAQLWDILMDALDTLAETLPDGQADAASFAALLRQVLGTVRIGAIPGGTDEIVIGSADQVRLGEIRHVILLGAADGEFPGPPSEDGFFSDTDKIRLEGEGILLSATTDDRMKEELFWFYRAAALAHRSLTLLLPQTDGGTPLSPSLAAERVLSLFPAISVENADAWGAEQTVWQPQDAAKRALSLRGTAAGAALARLGALPERQTAAVPLSGQNEAVSAETAAMLFPARIPLTQSRLDSFVLCRFGYYCRYVMKLEEEKEASLTAVNVGTFLHRVLELYFSRVQADEFPLPEERIRTLTDEVIRDVVREICPDDAPGGRAAYLFTRLRRCVLPILHALDAEFAQSEFRPVRFELPIGTDAEDALPSLPIPTGDGHEICLRGTVDRLDAWRDGDDTYVRVVDYKTGAKKFSEKDISVGINIQLLLYLFAVLRCPPGEFRRSLTGKRDGSLKAAGALYFSTRPGTSRSDRMLGREEAQKLVQDDIDRSGVLVDDERVLRAMEPDLAGEFIPLKRRKDGSSDALSEERLAELEKTMIETIARVGGELCSGGAQARPQKLHGKDPCSFCKMRSLCRTDPAGQKENDDLSPEGADGKEGS